MKSILFPSWVEKVVTRDSKELYGNGDEVELPINIFDSFGMKINMGKH